MIQRFAAGILSQFTVDMACLGPATRVANEVAKARSYLSDTPPERPPKSEIPLSSKVM